MHSSLECEHLNSSRGVCTPVNGNVAESQHQSCGIRDIPLVPTKLRTNQQAGLTGSRGQYPSGRPVLSCLAIVLHTMVSADQADASGDYPSHNTLAQILRSSRS